MYQVMLVDDDVTVLEFLNRLVPWDELGFELVGKFTNALDAIRCCGQGERLPDLMITDIGMPGLDGLGLIQRLQAIGPEMQFVILSCHDEFHYAQQAVHLGVQDYILKETLSLESIRETVIRVKGKLKADHDLRLHVDRLNNQANRSRTVLKEKWLRNLLSNQVGDDPALFEQLREFGMKTELGHFIPVCCRIHRFHDAMERYRHEDMVKFIVENAVEELLREENDLLFFSYSAQEFFLLHASGKDLASNPYEQMIRVSRRLQRAFFQYLKLGISVLIGEKVAIGSDLKRQFPKLLVAAEAFFYSEGPVIAKLCDLPQLPPQEDLFMFYPEYSDKLNRLLLEENGDIEPVADSFVEFLRERKYRPSSVKPFVWKLALDLQMKLKFKLHFDKEKMQHDISQMLHYSEIRDWLLQFIREAVKHAELISRQSKKAEIVDAQKYVQLNLERKITLEEVAGLLHLNVSYFSRLFKKETGENFIEYVTRVKMEQAGLLLTSPGNTVEKVALMLGYDNKSYFVKLFKQHFGVSPSRYI